MTAKQTRLETVLKYKHNDLVQYFAKSRNIPATEAEELFVDLKRWLWLNGQGGSRNFKVRFFRDCRIVDEFWHTFLLFTKDYVRFCERYFGRIIYHRPEPHMEAVKQEQRAKVNPDRLISDQLEWARRGMEEVVKLLGTAVLIRWYQELPRRYGG